MRINGLSCYSYDDDDVQPGKYFLVRVIPQGREEHYVLQTIPGRTNQSHEIRLTGWLGETDNVSRFAGGAVQVTRREGGGLRVRRIDAQALYDEVSQDHVVEMVDEAVRS
mgnify:CR=1 FL=1